MSKTVFDFIPSFITISDVHHGAKPEEQMRHEFYGEGGFFDVLDAALPEPEFLGVAITGDWWDCKLSMNDPKAKLGTSIVVDIMTRCKSHNKWLIILRGTYSHDLQQLDHFKELEVTYEKFRLFNTVEEFQFGPLKTLIVPEEYPKDPDEYYGEYYDRKYDLILGHGFFDFNCFDSNDAEKSMPSMPVFDAEKFCKMAPLTIFGHDHTHKNFIGAIHKGMKGKPGRIFYNGSFSRLCHGEEPAKGFLYVVYDPSDIQVNFIENELAPKYVTVNIESLMRKVTTINFESIVKTTEAYRKAHGVYDLKVKVPAKFSEEYRNEVELAKNYFSSRDGFRFETGRLSIAHKDENVTDVHGETENGSSIENSQYAFLFGNDDIVTKIGKFIDTKHNGEITLSREDIAQCLAPVNNT
jgi:hypothetical protein